VTERVPSKGVGLSDGLWSLVLGNIAGLLRVGTVTQHGKYLPIGESLISGETSWTMHMTHAAYQRYANAKFHMTPKELYLGWHVVDGGTGLNKGLQRFLASPTPKGSQKTSGRSRAVMLLECNDESPAQSLFLPGAPSGLNNNGVFVCYCNALVQCLRPVLPLVELDWRRFGSSSVHVLLSKLLAPSSRESSCLDLIRATSECRGKEFPIGQQHDPEEFLLELVACIKKEAKAQKKKVAGRVTRRSVGPCAKGLLDGLNVQTVESRECADCGQVTRNVPVDTPGRVLRVCLTSKRAHDLQDMINDLQAPRDIQDPDYTCPSGCAGNSARKARPGIRQTRSAAQKHTGASARETDLVLATGGVAILLIKRWDGDQKVKNAAKVKFERSVDLKVEDAGTASMHVVSFLVHKGRSGHKGHYVGFIESPSGQWFKCDDGKVTPITFAAARRESATGLYMLFLTDDSAHPDEGDSSSCGGSRADSDTADNSEDPESLASSSESEDEHGRIQRRAVEESNRGFDYQRCWSHFRREFLPHRRLQARLSMDQFHKIMWDVRRVRLFPAEWHFETAWSIIAEYWRKKGCATFIDMVDQAIIPADDNSSGAINSIFALGVPGHTSALERNNREVRKDYQRLLTKHFGPPKKM
jgi:hypothetical protein